MPEQKRAYLASSAGSSSRTAAWDFPMASAISPDGSS